jgi:hypothetical protein
MFSKFGLVLHFDVREYDDFDLDRVHGTDQIFEAAWESVPIFSETFQIFEDEDEFAGASLGAETNLSLPGSLIKALSADARVHFDTAHAYFAATLSGVDEPNWATLRRQMIDIRSIDKEPEDTLDLYWLDGMAVDVSLKSLYLSGTEEQYIDVDNRALLIDYLDDLASTSENHESISSFLAFFEPEIQRFKEGSASELLESWFSTELLLTQRSIAGWIKSGSFLAPKYEVGEFDWSTPAEVPLILKNERFRDPKFTHWLSPMRKLAELSDQAYFYEFASDRVDRVTQGNVSFNKVQTAALMLILHGSGLAGEAPDWLSPLMSRFSDEIETVSHQIGEKYDWEDWNDVGIVRDSECAKYISELELPEDLEEFWDEWLKAIGRNP